MAISRKDVEPHLNSRVSFEVVESASAVYGSLFEVTTVYATVLEAEDRYMVLSSVYVRRSPAKQIGSRPQYYCQQCSFSYSDFESVSPDTSLS